MDHSPIVIRIREVNAPRQKTASRSFQKKYIFVEHFYLENVWP